MNLQRPRYTEPLDAGQVCVVALSNGQTSCWTASSQALRGFNDPRVWEGLTGWTEYFMPQLEQATWGFEGDGLVAVDLDGKRSFSLNEGASIITLELPFSYPGPVSQALSMKAFANLLARPDQWRHVRLELNDIQAPGGLSAVRHATLADVLPAGTTPGQAQQRLALEPDGTLKWNQHRYRVLPGSYLPAGWRHDPVRGRDAHLALRDALRDLHAAGFAPPDVDNVADRARRLCQGFSASTQNRILGEIERLLDTWPAGQFQPPVRPRATHRRPRR